MILADTGIWIDHLRSNDRRLMELLGQRRIVLHPYVLGELMLGHVRDRDAVLARLRVLPRIGTVELDAVMAFISQHALAGSGIGWVDASLLAAANAAGGSLWTRDTRLRRAAERLNLAADE